MKQSILFDRAPEASRIQYGVDEIMRLVEGVLKNHAPHKCDGLTRLAQCDLCLLAYNDAQVGAKLATRLIRYSEPARACVCGHEERHHSRPGGCSSPIDHGWCKCHEFRPKILQTGIV